MYEPDPGDYQQLEDPHTGRFDCTAYSAAWIADAHTAGRVRLTGEEVRRASDEATPDPSSPGLNLVQVDAAVRKLTDGVVDMDTRLGLAAAEAQRRVAAGEWAVVQLVRGALVDAGVCVGFRGPHAVTVHQSETTVYIGDPLVPHYVPVSWGVLWHACGEFAGAGRVNASLLKPPAPKSYSLVIQARATVQLASLSASGCISGWTERQWGALPSSAPCRMPTRKRSCKTGAESTVVYVTRGAFAGRWVHAGSPGVTVREVPA